MGSDKLRRGGNEQEDRDADELAADLAWLETYGVGQQRFRPRHAPGRITRTMGLDQRVMRRADGDTVDPAAAELIADARGSGQALEAELRQSLERALGTTLDDVRVHTGGDADQAARAVGARAFAVGEDIFFRAGTYDPTTAGGRHLIAHEVAHTVQARGATPTAGDKLEIVDRHDGLEHEADAFADTFAAAFARAPEPERRRDGAADRHPPAAPLPVRGRMSNSVLLRAPGDVLRANEGDLTLFLSQYEGDARVPAEATRAFLTEPQLLAMCGRLRDAVLANRRGGRPPLSLDGLFTLALTITTHRGTALLLCHNVTKGFARASTALNIARMSNADFYAHFGNDLGRNDPGDWYHYFVISLPAFYTAAGALDTAPNQHAGETMGMSAQRGLVTASAEMIAEGMRDRAIPSTPAYEGWLNANALSFLEGGFYGHDQAEVDSESSVHVTGAVTGVQQAGAQYDPRWKWYVPIVRGIGDARQPNADQILENLGRIRNGEIEAFTHQLLDEHGTVTRVLNTAVAPRRPQPGQPQQPPQDPQPPQPPPPNSGGGGGGGILRRQADPGAASVAPPSETLHQLVGAATAGGGTALPAALRQDMEARFGRDLARVRIHTDGAAASSARDLGARAFTVGSDIVFGASEYAPDAPGGRELLAHELAHTMQAGGASGDGLALGATDDAAERDADAMAARALGGEAVGATADGDTSQIRRQPGSTAEIHNDLIEQWRAAHGFPPGGIDPITQQPVGPTDSEIRFGGLLDRWLASRAQRSVPAPAQAPQLTAQGTTSVVAGCQNAPDVGACRQHQNFIQNILPAAVANIRAVASPYSAAIFALYDAGLRAIRGAQQIVPGPGVSPMYPAQQVPITVGGQQHTVTLIMSLAQRPNGPNGWAPSHGARAIIELNESSRDVLTSNLAGVEETMVHEAMHILTELTESHNQARTQGTAAAAPSIDRSSYPAQRQALITAVTPFVQRQLQLPSVSAQDRQAGPASWTDQSVDTFMSEALARVEAGVYAAQRSGRGFGPGDVRNLPSFLAAREYWASPAPNRAEVNRFLTQEAPSIEAQVRPRIFELQDQYLNQRP